MSTYELTNFPSPEDLARAVAAQLVKEIEALSGASAPYCVALAGGRIARRFLNVAAELAQARHLDFTQVHFFWGDERCVPPMDPESNFRLARESLLEPLKIPEDHIHRIRGEDPPEAAAAQGERDLCDLAPRNRESQPVLDLIFLGMGEEGHVASLFPGEPEAVRASPAVYRAVIASKPPPHRITLGYPAIAAARQVWVMASGPGKENALRESLAPEGQTPLARVLKLRSHTSVFTDLPIKPSGEL
jgi:6-phosphogluconolactonase